RSRRADPRSTGDTVTRVPGHLPRRRGDGALAASTAAHIWYIVDHWHRLRHSLYAVWYALRLLRRPAIASGTGGGSQCRRSRHHDHTAPHRRPIADTGIGRGLAVYFPDRQQGARDRGVVGEPSFTGHRGGDFRSVGERTGRGARGVRPDLDH